MIGEIAGPYRWADDDKELYQNDYCNIRKVKWIKTVPRISFSRPALHSFGSFSSVSSSDEYLDEVKAVLRGDVTSASNTDASDQPDVIADEPPTADQVNQADQTVQETEDYLLNQWSRTAQDFEEIVAAVFRAMGYTATTQSGTHDLGVDVIAHPDPLGVQPPRLKIQAKSGTSTVGAPAVKQLRGIRNDGEKAVLIALGGFSNDALHVQQNDADVVLIDGARFVELFLEFYERLEPEMRHRFPLKRVYVPAD
jgi:restriction system protein